MLPEGIDLSEARVEFLGRGYPMIDGKAVYIPDVFAGEEEGLPCPYCLVVNHNSYIWRFRERSREPMGIDSAMRSTLKPKRKAPMMSEERLCQGVVNRCTPERSRYRESLAY